MTIGDGKVGAYLNKMEKILKESKLLFERNYYPPKLNSHLSDLRKLDYLNTWKFYLSNSHYNFQLNDNALFHFTFDLEKPSYSYFGCPYDSITYKDFLIENDFSFDEVGENFYSDYETYLDSCSPLDSPITIRYDLDFNSYTEGLHPVSHIHIGHKNQIRIGTKFLLDPFAFFCFIIRQVYPEVWLFLLEDSKYKSEIVTYKEKVEFINAKFFNAKDKYELYLV